jgi:RimJ/RimL family protein N-acetyltransferase
VVRVEDRKALESIGLSSKFLRTPNGIRTRAATLKGWKPLRRFTLDDVDAVTRACQDPEIVRWTASIPVPYTESDARNWIGRHDENWDSGFTASLAIVDASDGTFMGNINVIVPTDGNGWTGVGYWVASWGRGRGMATRALVVASKWAFDVLEPPEIFLETLEGNRASERVAEKAGYVFDEYRSNDYTRPESRGQPEVLRVKGWVLSPNGSGDCSNS